MLPQQNNGVDNSAYKIVYEEVSVIKDKKIDKTTNEFSKEGLTYMKEK
jgi:hypothetical protein